MAGVEWVYDAHSLPEGEPQILETESDKITPKVGRLLETDHSGIDGTDDEPTCYGDDADPDIDETLVDPAAAFEAFAGRLLRSNGDPNDFQAMYNQSSEPGRLFTVVQAQSAEAPPSMTMRPPSPSESRKQRLERLRKEIGELTAEITGSDGSQASSGDDADEEPFIVQLEEVRRSLEKVSFMSLRSATGSTGGLLLRKLSEPQPKVQTVQPDIKKGDDGRSLAYVENFPRDAAVISDLDLRLRSIERILAPSAHLANYEGVNGMIKSVRTFLDASNGSALDDMRANIERLVCAVESHPALPQIADSSDLIQRLDAVGDLAGAIPGLAARLKSIKSVFDDVADVSTLVADLNARYDAISNARKENLELIRHVSSSLDENMRTVYSNLDALRIRIEDISKSSSPQLHDSRQRNERGT